MCIADHRWSYDKPDEDGHIFSRCIDCGCFRVVEPDEFEEFLPFPKKIIVTKTEMTVTYPKEIIDDLVQFQLLYASFMKKLGGY